MNAFVAAFIAAFVNVTMAALIVVAGIYLSMRCIAALHRIVDLGYALRREKWRIARGLVGWGGVTFLFYLLLPARLEGVFLSSLLGYALLYIGLWSGIRILLALRWRRVARANSTLDDGGHPHPARRADGNQPPA